MAFSIDQLFANMESADVGAGGSPKLGRGKHRLRTKGFRVHNGHWGLRFIAEFDVVESTSPTDPPGSTRSYTLPMDNRQFNPLGPIKELAFAMLGHDPKTVGKPQENPEAHRQATHLAKCACEPAFAAAASCPPSLFTGIELVCETWPKPPSKNAQPGTQQGVIMKHAFLPGKSLPPGAIAAMPKAEPVAPPPQAPAAPPAFAQQPAPPAFYPQPAPAAPSPAFAQQPAYAPAPFQALPVSPPAPVQPAPTGRPTYEQWLAAQGLSK